MYGFITCRTQFQRITHKQELPKVVRHRRVEIMVGRRGVMVLGLGLLSHLFMHSPTLRPLPAPVLPAFNAIRHPLKIIDVYAIGNKAGSPVVDRALYKLVSRHVFILSFVANDIY